MEEVRKENEHALAEREREWERIRQEHETALAEREDELERMGMMGITGHGGAMMILTGA